MKAERTGAELTVGKPTQGRLILGGVAGWLKARMRRIEGPKQRMALVERIALGPRQSLALVEADGQRFLVATSAEGGPAFLALDGHRRSTTTPRSPVAMRISW